MGRMARSADQKEVTPIRERIHVSGIVQGVGFRPYVYRLAQQNGISGYVLNRMGEVIIEAEGPPQNVHSFKRELQSRAVPPIRIDAMKSMKIVRKHDGAFHILSSEDQGRAVAVFPPDLAICSACHHDLYDIDSRFFQYPFTSCTYCGPRFSAIRSLPYDRQQTSFKDFSVCDSCKQEYQDPHNRRFHAQTIACPTCGPFIEIRDSSGKIITGSGLVTCHHAITNGQILAVKGVGGCHLVCDAARKPVIETLRIRKRRPNKPFAVMARNLDVIQNDFELTETEINALNSPAAPIVLLTPKTISKRKLPVDLIAPGLSRIGIMLPYSPLHHLLFPEGTDYLIATSGNSSGHPITYTNEAALHELSGIADLFVLHNREIVIWNDDSVGQAVEDEFQLIRRSRGFVPEALSVPLPPVINDTMNTPVILGTGAELKNTFCFLHNGKAFMSQHIGNMDTLENLESYQTALNHMSRLLDMKADLTVYDPHPEYRLTQHLLHENKKDRLLAVYHHHAHMAACMAENMIDTPVIACILDGTGFGRDGTLWGFEILTGDYLDYERVHHLKPILLPGGEAAIRKPWMMGLSLLYEACEGDRRVLDGWISDRLSRYRPQIPIVLAQLEGKLFSPRVSSAGRLFDGVSALLHLCMESSYEGEAAVRLSDLLEAPVKTGENILINERYPFTMQDDQWDVSPLIRGIMHDLQEGVPVRTIAYQFHHTLASMILEGVRKAHRLSGITKVVFSGGVWHNRYLLQVTRDLLLQEGYSVYTHKKVPAGDGGIALGQAVCGLWRWAEGNVSVGSGNGGGSTGK